jgi:hypothetical protein
MKYTLYRENWKFVNTFVHCLYFATYPQKQHTKVRDYNVWLYKLTRNKDDKIFEKYLQFYSIISLCRWCCNIHFMSQTNLELCFFSKIISEERGWDSINWFNTATFLCLSQARTWISTQITWSFLCSMSWDERCLFVLLISVDNHCFNFLSIFV